MKLRNLLNDIFMYRHPKQEPNGMVTLTKDVRGVIIGIEYFRDIMNDPIWWKYIQPVDDRPYSYLIVGKPLYRTNDIDENEYLIF